MLMRSVRVLAPEGLLDADRIVHNLGHDGIPVSSAAVIEHAVESRTEVLGAAVRHHGDDVHSLALGARSAGAVDEEHPAKLGHIGVLAHIGNLDAEFAAALVDEQAAGLEDGARTLAAAIEVAKHHIIAQHGGEIAIKVKELAHLVDGI